MPKMKPKQGRSTESIQQAFASAVKKMKGKLAK